MMRAGAAALAVLFAVFAQPVAGDEPYLPATLTAPQLFELNRRAAGSATPGAYHIVSQTRSVRGDLWTSDTYRNGRDYRTTVRQGDFVWAYGADRGRPWHQNVNGLVTATTGLFQQDDPFAAALRSPQDPSNDVRVLGMTRDASPKVVVEVTPRNDLVERRYYDAHSYLLAKTEIVDYDGHRQVWEYGDYRRVYGMNLAHTVSYERDGSSVTAQSRIVTYERLSGDPPSLATPQSRTLFDMGGADSVEIPADFTDQGIFVPVTVNGRTLDFLLDSGSSQLLIDPGVAGELGMSSSGSVAVSFAGDFTLANARAASVSVGGLSAKNVAFSTAGFVEDLTLRRVVGLLGTDFIASGALELNFEKKTLTLLRTAPADLAAKGWSPLPLRLDYGVPMLKASFSGLDGDFIADLGADYSTLYPHYFARFPDLVPRGTPDQEEMVTIGGKPFGIKHITMRSLVLGDWVFSQVQVVVPSAQYAQERDYDGLIGRDTLGSFDLIFDYANERLWFKPIDFGIK